MSQRGVDNARQTGPALEAMYRFMLWLIPTVEKFPRSQKFLLGDRIQGTALDVLERLIEATYTKARRPALLAANPGLEKVARYGTSRHGRMESRQTAADERTHRAAQLSGDSKAPPAGTARPGSR